MKYKEIVDTRCDGDAQAPAEFAQSERMIAQLIVEVLVNTNNALTLGGHPRPVSSSILFITVIWLR